ncbi:RNaseH domain-containing protein [Noviherbaspirillum autotrophicum]|uniref:Uncharacterized protein n=1 Tax=Noviherbaspirillum autotrophicum TaxID=709839 RepID=A0A0C1YHT1_9BURK|nr:RNaseH domain-containing protein [Noviherbaspirillum autotrophicum]KIF80057.1 hypothetical protein TSA66_03280 [Noviherbaspirillum autotrophicum]
MMDTNSNKTLWRRRMKSDRDTLILGRRLADSWLDRSLDLVRIRITGELAATLTDMLTLSRNDKNGKKINLPMTPLRAALIARLPGVISVDTDLGLAPDGHKRHNAPAIEMYPPHDEATEAALPEQIANVFKTWFQLELAPWLKQHGMDAIAVRVSKAISPSCITITPHRRAFVDIRSGPDFTLIARDLADRLVSQELFDGLPPCQLIAKPEFPNNVVDLMTPPQKAPSGEFFSMVARIAAVSIPYASGVFLKVSAMRRVWANELPKQRPGTPRNATAYVFHTNHPVMMVATLQAKKPSVSDEEPEYEWIFGDAYSALRRASANMLPATLAEAIKLRFEDEPPEWWAGFPETTRLYKSVHLRTVFEADEADLLKNVELLLADALAGEISHVECSATASRPKTDIAMINVRAVAPVGSRQIALPIQDGIAGQSLEQEATEEDESEFGITVTAKLDGLLAQNAAALEALHGSQTPTLYVFTEGEREAHLIKKVAEILFGNAINVSHAKLPEETHGLRSRLPNNKAKATERFDTRVKQWKNAASQIAGATGPRYVLICAPDKENMRTEDPVNYYAGLHAMCAIGNANVHHVLPIAPGKSVDKAEQSFVHRVQSALMDVFLAHSGLVFGLPKFIDKQFAGIPPAAIYGLQAMRSKARAYSGESNVCFLIVTKLVVATGVTHVRYIYKDKSTFAMTGWSSLADGLRWLGSQRNLQGDENWLKTIFEPAMKVALNDINSEDPRAMVMVDWFTMAGLWKGIRDADLVNYSPPRLGAVNLAIAFPDMSFVRIRSGDDTVTLRGVSRTIYEGIQVPNLEPTGERRVDEYLTTQKKLVEIAMTDPPTNKRAAHFLLSMGYSKTSHPKRGQSCYRSMPRMVPMQEKAKEDESTYYNNTMLAPATKECSIPATMDITVMHCPTEVEPQHIAATVMGLRLGYAHYNDWTRLPAPLFFKRKIDDFVIRYPKDDDGSDAAEMIPDSVDGASEATTELDVFSVVANKVFEGSPSAPITEEPTSEADTLAVNDDDEDDDPHDDPGGSRPDQCTRDVDNSESHEDASVDHEDVHEEDIDPNDDPNDQSVLARAKRLRVPALYTLRDLKNSRLYCEMIQQDRIKVFVDLPSFATSPNTIEVVDMSRKRDLKRFWDSQRYAGYVPKSGPGAKIPTSQTFQDWMHKRLVTPQSAISLNSNWLFNGKLPFPKIQALIDAYNVDAPEPFRTRKAERKELVDLARWTVAQGDDEKLAWLIFHVAQCPGLDYGRQVLRQITPDVVGPLATEALTYYIACAEAVEDALDQFANGKINSFRPIRKLWRKELPEAAAPAAPVRTALSFALSSIAQQSPLPGVFAAPVNPYPQSASRHKHDGHDGSTFMNTKHDILSMIEGLDISMDDLPERVTAIHAKVDTLLTMYEEHRRQQEEVAKRNEEVARQLEETNHMAHEMAAKLAEHADLHLVDLQALDITADILDGAQSELHRLSVALKTLLEAEEHLAALDAPVERKLTIGERAQRSKQIAEATDQALYLSQTLADDVRASVYFRLPDASSSPSEVSTTAVVPSEIVVEYVVTTTMPTPATEAGRVETPVDNSHAEPAAPLSVQPVAALAAIDEPELPVKSDAATPAETTAMKVPEPMQTTMAMPSDPAEVAKSAAEAAQTVIQQATVAIGKIMAKQEDAPAAKLATATASKPMMETPLVIEETNDDSGDLHVDQDEALKALNRLFDKRRYALADVHAQAMTLAYPSAAMKSHEIVLRAACKTLDSIDCRFHAIALKDGSFNHFLQTYTTTDDNLCRSLPIGIGVLAASVVTMLFDDTMSDQRWSALNFLNQRFVDSPALKALIDHIGSLDNLGVQLTSKHFIESQAGVVAATEAEIKRMQNRAANWQHDPEIFSNWNHRGFTQMHIDMHRPNYLVGQALIHIARGDNDKLQAMNPQLLRRLDKPTSVLEEIQKRVHERGKLDGQLRVRFIENITTTRKFIETYLELVDKKAKPAAELPKAARHFLVTLHKLLQEAKGFISTLPVQHEMERAYQLAAMRVIDGLLHLYVNEAPRACIPYNDQLLLIQVPLGQDFRPSMIRPQLGDPHAYPRVCDPQEVLRQTVDLSNEPIDLEAVGSEENLTNALRDAMRGHLANVCFLPTFTISARLTAAGAPQDPNLLRLYQDAKSQLGADLHDARQRVAHAMALSALQKDETNRLQNVIASIEQANNSPDAPIGRPNGSSLYPDFPHARAALNAQVFSVLDERFEQKRVKIRTGLDNLISERGTSILPHADRIGAMLNSHSASMLLAANDQYTILRRDGRLPPKPPRERIAPEIYREFIGAIKSLRRGNKPFLENLRDKLLEASADNDPLALAGISEEDRHDAAHFIDAWLALRNLKPREAEEPIANFFKLAGMSNPPTLAPSATYQSNRIAFHFPDRAFAYEHSNEFFVPPLLGSRGNLIQGFVINGRPKATDLRVHVTEVGNTPTFLLAHTTLDLEQRSKTCSEHPVIIVDDELVAYMAMAPGKRIRRMLEVGLLTFHTNPYTAEGSAAPPEMFVGREREFNELYNIESAGVLYGGRRLGKSSLLDQILRRSRGLPGESVVYIQMQGAASTEDHVLFAWRTIYNALTNNNIIQKISTDIRSGEQIQEWIETQLSTSKTCRSCFLLIDEADDLMGLELQLTRTDASFVRGLQQMCERVKDNCKVRYVIAGLHNMTRMASEENSPLGKAKEIALEPFNSDSDIRRGIQLITRPLNALGFFFDKDSDELPYRILSVCNFYPAFIQIYCQKLLNSLYNKRGEGEPITYITEHDLDTIERSDKLLQDMQHKFGLNLELDKRYKAIALILADDYYADSDSTTMKGMTASQIRECCETYTPILFQKTSQNAYEALLDEMQKLNVLDKVGSRYVLRNQNIAMMLGDRERVMFLLSALELEKPVDQRSQGELRPAMVKAKSSDQRPVSLFPMPMGWLRANADCKDDELIIVTGNNASGLVNMYSMPDEWSVSQSYVYSAVSFSQPRTASQYLLANRRDIIHEDKHRLLAVTPNRWTVQQIGEYASLAAREFQTVAKHHKPGVRFVLIALPDLAYKLSREIAQGSLSLVDQPPGKRFRIEPVPCWSDDALYYYLRDNPALADNADARRAILEATCGFGGDIQKLCRSNSTVDTVMAGYDAATKSIAPNLDTFYKHIGMPEDFITNTTLRKRTEDFLSLAHTAVRSSQEFQDLLTYSNIDEAMFEFLQWMGLLQSAGNTWHVPSLYMRLLK